MKSNKRTVYFLPDYGLSRCVNFGHYYYNSVEPRLEKHFHENIFEICFCIKGEQYYKIGETLYKLRGGELIIIEPNMEHSTGAYPEDKGELYWLQVSINEDLGLFCNLPIEQSKELFYNLLKLKNKVIKGNLINRKLLKSFEYELNNSDDKLRDLKINHLIVQILLSIIQSANIEQVNKFDKRREIVEMYIEENISRVIYVDELANLVDLSLAYFKAWFKESIGTSPKEYINRKKISQAKIDLKTEKSVTKVAFNLGYNSSQYFATCFKKYTGVTPSQFINFSVAD